MKRLLVLALPACLAVTEATAQAPERVYRLGALLPTKPALQLIGDHVLPRLSELGFIEGRNLILETRLGEPADLPALARELVAAKPDVIVTVANIATAAAKAATDTIPIVMNGADPVELGWAESLSRPGGNVTGTVMLGPDLDRKRLQLLAEALPHGRRLAVLVAPQMTRLDARKRELRELAGSIGFEVSFFEIASSGAYPSTFETIRGEGFNAVMVGSDPQFRRDAALIARLARRAGLPTICHWRDMAKAGCMLSYGPSLPVLFRRMGEIAARLLNGESPSTTPIEGPTAFEFVVNLKTAQAIGKALPDAVVLQADEVIE